MEEELFPRTEHSILERDPRRIRLIDSIKKTVFIVGSALLVFSAFRNTLTIHAQSFWGASGDFWQAQWMKIYDFLGGDQYVIGCYGTIVFSVSYFWILNIILTVIDLIHLKWSTPLLKYKIQSDVKPDPKKLLKVFLYVLIVNHGLVGIPFLFLMYECMLWRGCSMGPELPSFGWVVGELLVFILVEELMFYYSHRMFHHPLLYKRIHKLHHSWTAPTSIVCIYAHPIEHLISNLLPVVSGPLICGSHVATTWMWIALALFSTANAHCGYHFPLFPSPESHDFHHLKFINNFGVLGILDRLHGTDALFRKTKAYKRHIFSLSLVPMRELFPEEDDAKKCK